MPNSHRVVIFDFDGTLADVASILRELYDEESVNRGWPKLTEKDYRRLRKGSVKQVMEWVGIKAWQLPGLLSHGRKKFRAKSRQVELFKGIPEVIDELEKSGWRVYILSSNSAKTIYEILRRNKTGGNIQVLRRPGFFGKAASIKRLMQKESFKKENVWMVGDEVRDIEAAHKAGVKSIAVTWGLQDQAVLRLARPTFSASKPADILKYLKKGE